MPETATPTIAAYDLLRAEILHGDLMPGERLRVAELNTRYSIGLTPIREALMRLASEGLVLNESNRGARVRTTSVAELQDLMSTRRELEANCLRLAMTHGGPEWEAEILRSLHLLSRAPVPDTPDDRDGTARWEALHRQFHHALVVACGSEWRLTFWNTLVDHSERYRKLRLVADLPERAHPRDIHAEHEAIAAAVINREVEQALALMDSHLARTGEVVARMLQAMEQQKLSTGEK